MTAATSPALSVIMPVYNEVAAIGEALEEWADELGHLGIDYEIRVYDDGSKDATPDVLSNLAKENPRLVVERHENRGHGPTILRGYREATAPWVFQTDSDGEMDVHGFAGLWEHREDYDFLFGTRDGRESSPVRWLVTRVSRLSVWLLFARGVSDVNTPYRLMRSDALRPLLAGLPDDLFAPNVILSGLAAKAGLRIYEIPVAFLGRRHGGGSLVSFNILRPAARSLAQTIGVVLSGKRAR